MENLSSKELGNIQARYNINKTGEYYESSKGNIIIEVIVFSNTCMYVRDYLKIMDDKDSIRFTFGEYTYTVSDYRELISTMDTIIGERLRYE